MFFGPQFTLAAYWHNQPTFRPIDMTSRPSGRTTSGTQNNWAVRLILIC